MGVCYTQVVKKIILPQYYILMLNLIVGQVYFFGLIVRITK